MQNFSKCESFQTALLPTVFGLEFPLALLGNLFALWLLLLRERRNWHTGVVLSCNLAISDLLYVLTLPLLIVYYAGGKRWTFGEAACKMERFLFTLNLYASIFFVMAISVNRCVALVWPFFTRSHVRPAHAKAASVVVWIVVGLVSSPVLKFASLCVHNNKTMCVSVCHVGGEGHRHFSYKIFLTAFGFLLPFLVTFTSYLVVFRVVCKNANISALDKQKVAVMVTSVLVLYAVSFVPYHFFQMYYLYVNSRGQKVACWLFDIYQVSKGLAALNMCIHPILYTAVFDSIRVACCGKSNEDGKMVGQN